MAKRSRKSRKGGVKASAKKAFARLRKALKGRKSRKACSSMRKDLTTARKGLGKKAVKSLGRKVSSKCSTGGKRRGKRRNRADVMYYDSEKTRGRFEINSEDYPAPKLDPFHYLKY